ncbi:hypothetical protein ABK040_007858 [Willaertia magna]
MNSANNNNAISTGTIGLLSPNVTSRILNTNSNGPFNDDNLDLIEDNNSFSHFPVASMNANTTGGLLPVNSSSDLLALNTGNTQDHFDSFISSPITLTAAPTTERDIPNNLGPTENSNLELNGNFSSNFSFLGVSNPPLQTTNNLQLGSNLNNSFLLGGNSNTGLLNTSSNTSKSLTSGFNNLTHLLRTNNNQQQNLQQVSTNGRNTPTNLSVNTNNKQPTTSTLLASGQVPLSSGSNGGDQTGFFNLYTGATTTTSGGVNNKVNTNQQQGTVPLYSLGNSNITNTGFGNVVNNPTSSNSSILNALSQKAVPATNTNQQPLTARQQPTVANYTTTSSGIVGGNQKTTPTIQQPAPNSVQSLLLQQFLFNRQQQQMTNANPTFQMNQQQTPWYLNQQNNNATQQTNINRMSNFTMNSTPPQQQTPTMANSQTSSPSNVNNNAMFVNYPPQQQQERPNRSKKRRNHTGPSSETPTFIAAEENSNSTDDKLQEEIEDEDDEDQQGKKKFCFRNLVVEKNTKKMKFVNSDIKEYGINGGSWSEREHQAFLLGLKECGYGKWREIADKYVKTRTRIQTSKKETKTKGQGTTTK